MKRITLAILLLLVGSTQSYGMLSRLRPLAARIAPKTARLSISTLGLRLSQTPASRLVSTKASVARPPSIVWQKRALLGLAGIAGLIGMHAAVSPRKTALQAQEKKSLATEPQQESSSRDLSNDLHSISTLADQYEKYLASAIIPVNTPVILPMPVPVTSEEDYLACIKCIMDSSQNCSSSPYQIWRRCNELEVRKQYMTSNSTEPTEAAKAFENLPLQEQVNRVLDKLKNQ